MIDQGKSSKHCDRPLHFCKMLKEGMMEEIHHKSLHPAVICCKCGAKADLPEYLCQPRPL